MNLKIILLGTIGLTGLDLLGQDQNKSIEQDPYAVLSRDLTIDICSDKPLEQLVENFCDNLQGDSLLFKLNDIRTRMTNGDKDCSVYIRRIVKDTLFFYNVNVHNEEQRKQYGDIRYVFMNREDMKIDMLLYFDHVELEDANDMYENIPPPPPPPPPGGLNKK